MSTENPLNILTVEYLLTKEFTSTDEFSLYIEKEAVRRNISNFEMLVEYCETKQVDPVAIASMISSRLKGLIQLEAETLNLMKKKTNKLPV